MADDTTSAAEGTLRDDEASHELPAGAERSRLLAEAADEGIAIHERGFIIEANPALARMFGYPPQALVGISLECLVTPETWRDSLSRSVAGDDRVRDGVGVRKNGSTFIYSTVGKPCRYHGCDLRVATFRDITQLKNAESELLLEKKRFQQLFENTPLAIVMVDPDDHVKLVNPAFARLFGYSPSEVRERPVNELIAPPGDEASATEISRTILQGRAVEADTTRRCSDGSVVPVKVYGVPVVVEDRTVAAYGIYADMSEVKRAERALRESEEKFRSLAEQSLQGMFVLRGDRIVFANRMLAEICGHARAEIESWTWTDVEKTIHRGDRRFVNDVIRAVERGDPMANSQVEYRLVTPQGEVRWVLQSVRRITLEGAPSIEGVLIDITERRRAEEQVLHSALYDSLTELPNRALFHDRLGVAMGRAGSRQDHAFAVLVISLDRFKMVNDSLGHAAGDLLLAEMGRRLERTIRPGDTVARLGGDEFAVLMTDLEHPSDAVRAAERLRRELARPFTVAEREVVTTLSIGIAFSASGYGHASEILRDAGTAMHRAKALGRDRQEVFDPAMHANAVANLQLEGDLRRALERREFVLHYQPIVALEEGRVVAFEALLRWQRAEQELLSPAHFLPLAEETGLIGQIDAWVLQEACVQASSWDGASAKLRPAVSVNLFGRELVNPQMAVRVKDALQASGLDPARLQVEITESALIEDPERAISVLQRIRDLDVKVNLDDFGTGYSSLSYLQHLPVDVLKIDRSFVSRLRGDGSGSEIVEAIVNLAHNLGMEALGEGIETAEQLLVLERLGCDLGQGFYFSRPLDARQVEELLEGRH